MVAGDAAGLAYPESGEGIKPAVESGRLAAEMLIAAGPRARLADLQPYEIALRRRYPPAARTPDAFARVVKPIGRALLRSRAFNRHVLIDRWFLRHSHTSVVGSCEWSVLSFGLVLRAVSQLMTHISRLHTLNGPQRHRDTEDSL